MPALAQSPGADAGANDLAREVASRGWILFSTKTGQGDYDLFLSRPDGSARRNLTQTPDANEFGGRFSPDGKRMLYRRQSQGSPRVAATELNHDVWGTKGALVIANADGSDPQPQGDEGAYPWASWSPDGKQIACLYKREGQIRIFDLATKRLVRELPRQGIFQQLFWSPDGKRLCGTANFERPGLEYREHRPRYRAGDVALARAELHPGLVSRRSRPRHLLQSHTRPGQRIRMDDADASDR